MSILRNALNLKVSVMTILLNHLQTNCSGRELKKLNRYCIIQKVLFRNLFININPIMLGNINSTKLYNKLKVNNISEEANCEKNNKIVASLVPKP
jgi:hypothetical protein